MAILVRNRLYSRCCNKPVLGFSGRRKGVLIRELGSHYLGNKPRQWHWLQSRPWALLGALFFSDWGGCGTWALSGYWLGLFLHFLSALPMYGLGPVSIKTRDFNCSCWNEECIVNLRPLFLILFGLEH